MTSLETHDSFDQGSHTDDTGSVRGGIEFASRRSGNGTASSKDRDVGKRTVTIVTCCVSVDDDRGEKRPVLLTHCKS